MNDKMKKLMTMHKVFYSWTDYMLQKKIHEISLGLRIMWMQQFTKSKNVEEKKRLITAVTTKILQKKKQKKKTEK